MKPLHIALVGHVAGEHVAEYLQRPADTIPAGYLGAPLTGILIGELLRLGHRVTAITTDSSLPLDGGHVTLEHGSFRLIVCPARRRAWRNNGFRLGRAVDGFLFERRQIGAAIRHAQPDIVHAHWSYEFALAAIAQPFPHLITCHDSPADVLRLTKNLYRTIRYFMARQVFRTGGTFSTVSFYIKDKLQNYTKKDIIVIPNPVSDMALTAGKARPHPVKLKIACIANGWDDIKNTAAALQAFALWRRQKPSSTLTIYGNENGPGETAERWAIANNLQQGVHFIGKLSHKDLLRHIATMDALLHTSREEAFGVAIVEALALGLPVVAGKTSGAVPWVMDADQNGSTQCGCLVNVDDVDSIATGLGVIFDDNYPTRSRAAINIAARYRPDAVAEKYVSAYRAIALECDQKFKSTQYE